MIARRLVITIPIVMPTFWPALRPSDWDCGDTIAEDEVVWGALGEVEPGGEDMEEINDEEVSEDVVGTDNEVPSEASVMLKE